MSVEATRDAVTGYLEALLRVEGYGRYLAEDAELTVAGTGLEARGRGAVEEAIRYLYQEAFGSSPEFRRLVFDDGCAAVEADLIGRHTSRFPDVLAKGQEVGVPCVAMFDLDGGVIRSIRIYVPVQLLLSRLGEAPAESHPTRLPQNPV